MQEDVQAAGGRIAFSRPPPVGAHVRPRASDVALGAVLLARGSQLGPGEVGLLASQGLAAVSVHRRPRVALLGTGDELRDLHDAPRPGSIINSNAYALAAQVQQAGGESVVLPNVGDELEATLRALEGALDCDLVLTCGGVSVGAYDLVKQAFASVGVAADFWKVDLKPGKPVTFGRRGRTPVVGLPGNPVSAMVTFEVLVRPGLRRLLGDPRPYRRRVEATLAVDHAHEPGRVELARATVAMRDGALLATPLKLQGSGSLPSMVGVDALLVLDAARSDYSAGDRLPAFLLRDETGSPVSPWA
jgi:molybdopterin molybdotransferase